MEARAKDNLVGNIVDRELERKEKTCDYSLHRLSRFLQPSLLLILSKTHSYGYQLIEKLNGLGFHKEAIDVGAVYRTLRKMEKEGFVESFWGQDKTKRKKRYYKITPAGKILLRMWIKRIKERKKAFEKFLRIYEGEKQ